MTEGRRELFGELRAMEMELLRWHYHRCYNSYVKDGLSNQNVTDAMNMISELTKVNYYMDWGRSLENGKKGVIQVSDSLDFLNQSSGFYMSHMRRYRLDAVLNEYSVWYGEQLRIKYNGKWEWRDDKPIVTFGETLFCDPASLIDPHFPLEDKYKSRTKILEHWLGFDKSFKLSKKDADSKKHNE